MLDFELQERLKQHTEVLNEGNRNRYILVGMSILFGLVVGLTGGYVFHETSVEDYEAELNQMVVLAAESKNLDSAATLTALEAEIGKPMSEFSEKDALNAFKYLVRNTEQSN